MDNHPKFTTHATAICNKERQISQLFLEYCHMWNLINASVISHLISPLIWMTHDRNVNNEKNRTHKQALSGT